MDLTHGNSGFFQQSTHFYLSPESGRLPWGPEPRTTRGCPRGAPPAPAAPSWARALHTGCSPWRYRARFPGRVADSRCMAGTPRGRHRKRDRPGFNPLIKFEGGGDTPSTEQLCPGTTSHTLRAQAKADAFEPLYPISNRSTRSLGRDDAHGPHKLKYGNILIDS